MTAETREFACSTDLAVVDRAFGSNKFLQKKDHTEGLSVCRRWLAELDIVPVGILKEDLMCAVWSVLSNVFNAQ